MERIHAVLRYDDDESGSRLTIIFEPAVLTVAGEQGKKTVLLLEDRDEMTWLISNFLADEYVVHQVKSVQLAFDEIRRSAPALLLVDMTMYANAESTFMEYVSRNRTLLSKTAFIPLLTADPLKIYHLLNIFRNFFPDFRRHIFHIFPNLPFHLSLQLHPLEEVLPVHPLHQTQMPRPVHLSH